ncbi:type I polyketide synthase [Actinomadura rubrisoli]|uniref:SDR family NAD(P)-dependent oxidoreductase n=1 Tax=Actinomadura rubrisoli TaxID=2530368 RepID=A0A4R5B0B5_9ACTN|nr:type I polyketide synthase [Actinomadura rubrisoli]TDD77910.1 SDR family NAD(P)-dependent oxidoreductase [Actinomadura rubrisoli]
MSERAVAIVGVGCRLPGGINDLDALWEALEAGRNLVGRIPPDRFDAARFVDEAMPRSGKSYTAMGGFLEDIAGFDSDYFGISPKEAAEMDPQHRLLLEMAAEALDDAGIAPASLAGSDTGVFIGISDMSFATRNLSALSALNAYSMTGAALSIAANRVSHTFDLRGPSMAIDTACSSSLMALERACRELTCGTGRRVMVAGGVNVLVSPYPYVGFSQASMLSRAGRCAAFSADADGFVRAEGGAVVVLKRLADALDDGDRVYGVLAGWGGNCDGRTAGLALPSPDAQEELLRHVYSEAGIHPDELVYLEAHGTGTKAGDPTECLAIGRALSMRRTGGPLPIGSVKTNLGHLEPASGMAGLLKALLVLRHGTIPASLHAERLNPDIDVQALRLRVVTEPQPLGERTRGYAGVSSYGFGGANAHVVLAPAPTPEPGRPQARPDASETGEPVALPVMVSARTPEALATAAARMADRLEGTRPEDFYDLAYTSCVRRGKHPYRLAVLATDPLQAAQRLLGSSGAPVAQQAAEQGRVGLVFCGNGSQWPGMGADLLASDAVFRNAVARVDAALTPRLGWSVAAMMASPAEHWNLTKIDVAQPLLFAVQVGLTEMLRARGVIPEGAVGHSVGEVAAAWAAGALTLDAAARVVAERSLAQVPTAGTGRMAAVGLAPADAEELIAVPLGLELAAVNSDRDVTLSGPEGTLAALGAELEARGVFFRMLDLDFAFHSKAMDPVEEPLARTLEGLNAAAPRIPLISTVTGEVVEGPSLDADYWWRNVREPVLFGPAIRRLLDEGVDVLVEVGPEPVLRGYLGHIRSAEPGAAAERRVVRTATLRSRISGPEAMDQATAELLSAGAAIDGKALFPRRGRVVSLPAYPWQRERYWSSRTWGASLGNGRFDHPLLGEWTPSPEPSWHGPIEPAMVPWLPDHQVGGAVVWPGTAYLEMALAAGRRVLGGPAEVVRLELTRALVLDWAKAHQVRLQTSMVERDGAVAITSTDPAAEGEAPPRRHAQGRVRALLARPPQPVDVTTVRGRCGRRIGRREHYQGCQEAGLKYGPAFQVLHELWVGSGEVLAAYRHAAPAEGFEVHPALMDGALQAGAPLLAGRVAAGQAFLPVRFGAVRLWGTPADQGWVHVRDRTQDPDEACWDITVTDDDGQVVAELEGVRLRRMAGRTDKSFTHHTVMRAAPHPDQPAAPSPLPSPSEIADRSAGQIENLRRDWRRVHYDQVSRRIDEIVAHEVHELLKGRLGDQAAFGAADVPGLLDGPRRARWLDLVMPRLQRHGLAAPEPPDRWRLLHSDVHPGDLWRTALPDSSPFVAYGALAQHMLKSAPALWRGEGDALTLLVERGTAEMMRHLYDLDPLTRFHNRIAQALLKQIVAAWPDDRPLRVLEVGAGTGGLTAALLPVLPPERTRYTYTDISPYFFADAQHGFGAYDFIEYRTLDLDADPAEQGFTRGAYDLLVAGNALHTATGIRAALRHTAALLAPGGHLLAFEIHNAWRLLPIFGWLGSFWAEPGDPDRPGALMLPRDRWPVLLAECGYTDVMQMGSDQEPAATDASVLLARTRPTIGDRPAGALPAKTPSAAARGLHVIAAETQAELPLAKDVAALLTQAGAKAAAAVVIDRAGAEPRTWANLLEGAGDDEQVTVTLLLGDPGTGSLLGDPGAGSTGLGSAAETTVRRAAVLRAVMAAYGSRPGTVRRSLVVVTRPSGALPAPERLLTSADAAVWGMARTLANEHATVSVLRISLQRAAAEARQPGPDGRAEGAARMSSAGDVCADARRLVHELARVTAEDPGPAGASGDEDEIVLTAAGRFVPREVRHPGPMVAATQVEAYRLHVRDRRLSYELEWRQCDPPPPPGPGMLSVAVRAAALNYRDIMNVTGLLPSEVIGPGMSERAPGFEYAGTITAVGPDVRGFAVGDRVAGVAHNALASRITADARAAFTLPDDGGFTEAVTMPVAFATVHHCLHTVARMRRGETLLVHGGAGAVGLASLQYAQRYGIRVIATAGSTIKRSLLRTLGAEHVFNSRTLEFVSDVMDATGGHGVDVVLNSLAGPALTRSLELLAPGGRFIEIGKRDIIEDGSLPLRPLASNITFAAVDLNELMFDAVRAGDLFAEVIDLIGDRSYTPLLHTVFPAARVTEAFALLRHSRHIGKVIVSLDPCDDPLMVHSRPTRPVLDPDGTYLVTGGLSGFGAATARHLADRGARHLALVSRRGDQAPEAPALLSALADRGVQATAYAADCADPDAMARVLDRIDREGRHRLRGIVHAAMHLDDASLAELTDERLAAILAPKMTGALVLDDLTRDRDLDLFCVYSSASAAVGNMWQAGYAAANLFLEALVRHRRRRGATGLAIAWGAIGDTGYVARNDLGDFLASVGLDPMDSAQALAAWDRALACDAEVQMVGRCDWTRLKHFLRTARAPRFSHLVPADDGQEHTGGELRAMLAALPPGEALSAVTASVAEQVAQVMQLDPQRLDHHRRLDEYGLDSLMAADLMNSLSRRLDLEISPVELLNSGGTIAGLAQTILLHLGVSGPAGDTDPPAATNQTGPQS